MSDLHTLLDRATEAQPPDPATVEADVRRGRRARRRHRAARTAIPAIAVVAVAAFGVTVANVGDEAPVADGVELAAYQGQHTSGYVVDALPEGWEIQGATPSHMTIAPEGFDNQDPSHFVGKLIVMLRSVDDFGTPAGDPVAVGDGTGYLNPGDVGATLTFEQGGRDVQVQVPPSLGWSTEDIVEFALGVQVTSDAVPAHG